MAWKSLTFVIETESSWESPAVSVAVVVLVTLAPELMFGVLWPKRGFPVKLHLSVWARFAPSLFSSLMSFSVVKLSPNSKSVMGTESLHILAMLLFSCGWIAAWLRNASSLFTCPRSAMASVQCHTSWPVCSLLVSSSREWAASETATATFTTALCMCNKLKLFFLKLAGSWSEFFDLE